MDILEALGTNIRDFFNESIEEKVVFGAEDIFVQENEEEGFAIRWLVTNSQKNALEPILITIEPGGRSLSRAPMRARSSAMYSPGRWCSTWGSARSKCARATPSIFTPRIPTFWRIAARLRPGSSGFPLPLRFKGGDAAPAVMPFDSAL